MELTVWAPTARTVDAIIGGDAQPLTAQPGGYWTITLWPGVDYLLSVDGGPGRPDPRSRWQPHGVHGPSRLFDVTTHPWGDTAWAGVDAVGKVLYELHIGTFTPAGTLDAAIDRLPILAKLGVDLVELLPVAAAPGDRGWGYDGVAPFSVHDAYGGPAALQRFVDAAHGYGLGVVLDVVYNHLGPSGNYLSQFGPYFTDKHHTPWGWAVNLDQEHSDDVRRYFVDTALTWFRDFHVDALRLDAIQTLADDSGYRFLAQLSDEVAQLSADLDRPLRIFGETDTNSQRHITPTAAGGDGLDGIWSDDFHHAVHAYVTGETYGYYQDFGSAEALATVLETGLWWDGRYSPYRDKPWGERFPENGDRRQLVACTQNHDQVGNRAIGDRPEASLRPGTVAGTAALLLLSPHTPLLFQGQEWGTTTPFLYFTDHDEELGRAVTEGRRTEFAAFDWAGQIGEHTIPDPQDRATFTLSVLNWDELLVPAHRRLWDWYRTLITLRSATYGDGAQLQQVQARVTDDGVVMRRGPLTVVAAPFDRPLLAAVDGKILATFGTAEFTTDETTGQTQLTVAPHGVTIVEER